MSSEVPQVVGLTPAPAKSSFVDRNFRSIADTHDFFDSVPEDLDPGTDEFDDTFKISNSVNVHVSNKWIVNYKEDCVDICRGSWIRMWNLTLEPRGRNGVTIKGSSVGCRVQAKFVTHGTECDVELGQFDNYWYPGRPPTRETELVLSSVDEHPVVVRVWDADWTIEGHSVAVLISADFPNGVVIRRVPKAVWFPYFLFRYTSLRVANLVRRFRGQPQIKTK